jgi:hypothetical protein
MDEKGSKEIMYEEETKRMQGAQKQKSMKKITAQKEIEGVIYMSTKNKIERPTAYSRLNFHKTGPRCPTFVLCSR